MQYFLMYWRERYLYIKYEMKVSKANVLDFILKISFLGLIVKAKLKQLSSKIGFSHFTAKEVSQIDI